MSRHDSARIHEILTTVRELKKEMGKMKELWQAMEQPEDCNCEQALWLKRELDEAIRAAVRGSVMLGALMNLRQKLRVFAKERESELVEDIGLRDLIDELLWEIRCAEEWKPREDKLRPPPCFSMMSFDQWRDQLPINERPHVTRGDYEKYTKNFRLDVLDGLVRDEKKES